MDLVESALDTWRINARLNLFLLDALDEDALAVPLAKGKSVGAQFAHIHSVRLMWLKVTAPSVWESLSKLEPTAGKAEIAAALTASAAGIEEVVKSSLESGGKVKNFKPHALGFLGYMISHESNHRAQIELALRQAGRPLSDKFGYGLWEWGVR